MSEWNCDGANFKGGGGKVRKPKVTARVEKAFKEGGSHIYARPLAQRLQMCSVRLGVAHKSDIRPAGTAPKVMYGRGRSHDWVGRWAWGTK